MAVDMNKRVESATETVVDLGKKAQAKNPSITDITAQVVLVMDFSGSMTGRYGNGEVQDLAERCLALALTGLDDDGTIQTIFFHNRLVGDTEEVTSENYAGFVRRWAVGKEMGGTAYVPPIREVLSMLAPAKRKMFGRRSGGSGLDPTIPTLVLFVTDGEPNDRAETKRALFDCADQPVFWQFLGLGYRPEFLAELDTMPGRVVDNVGLTQVRDTLALSDAEFFPTVLTEFLTNWLPEAKTKGIV